MKSRRFSEEQIVGVLKEVKPPEGRVEWRGQRMSVHSKESGPSIYCSLR